MRTELVHIDDNLFYAIDCLKNGMPIAFPTETVYGIGADIFNIDACKEIYKIKSRDIGKPLSAHVSSIKMAESVLDSPSDIFYRLAEKFLPGPLAIISKKNSIIDDSITAGFNSISIRFPDNDVCLKLIAAFGTPIAATSANHSGQTSLIEWSEVSLEFNNILPAIVVGKCELGTESTIISIIDSPKILRIGAIPKNEIEDLLNCKL